LAHLFRAAVIKQIFGKAVTKALDHVLMLSDTDNFASGPLATESAGTVPAFFPDCAPLHPGYTLSHGTNPGGELLAEV
jgi:hypothetical protein